MDEFRGKVSVIISYQEGQVIREVQVG
jgi:hypothetical protein